MDRLLRYGRILLKYLALFCFGGGLYYCIEVVFRIVRHHIPPLPHAFFLGGGAFLLGLLLCHIPMPRKWQIVSLPILGCGVLTGYEFLFGLYFLTTQGLRVWDYTGCNYEYRGLICLKFSLTWGALMWLILILHLLIERLLAKTAFSDERLFKKSQIQK